MLKIMIKTRYNFHMFLQKYNEALMQDALCIKLKDQLKLRAAHHGKQAFFLLSKI